MDTLRGVIERITYHNEENGYTVAKLMEAEGVFLPEEQRTAEAIAENWSAMTNMDGAVEHLQGNDHVMKMVQKAMAAS